MGCLPALPLPSLSLSVGLSLSLSLPHTLTHTFVSPDTITEVYAHARIFLMTSAPISKADLLLISCARNTLAFLYVSRRVIIFLCVGCSKETFNL